MDYELVVFYGHFSLEIIQFLERKEIDLLILCSYGASGMG